MKTKRYLLFLSAILIALAAVSNGLMAQTTIYVNSATGNDNTGDGTAGNPYKTFHKGYTSTSAGNILDLTGTFTWTDADETGDVAISGYLISKSITIQGQTSSETIIQAAATENTADRSVFFVRGNTVSVTMKNLTIRYGNNTANSGMDCYGGGITCGFENANTLAATLSLTNCKIQYNRSVSSGSSGYFRGGGLAADLSNLTIDNCDISNNIGSSTFYCAGGLYIFNPYGTIIKNSSITNNTGTDKDAISNSYSSAIGGLTIYRLQTGSTITLTNLTIAKNTSNSYGGGMGITPTYSGSCYLTNVTVAENTSTGTVYGGFVCYQNIGTLYIKNSIFANNHCSSGTLIDFYRNGTAPITDNGYNAVGSTTGYTWGANTLTGPFTSLNLSPVLSSNSSLNISKTLALEAGSVAINAGNGTANGSVSIPTTDQRGMDRNSTVDIGAFEYGGKSGTATWTGNTSTDWSVGSNWSGNSVPASTNAVTIPGSLTNYPVISGSYTATNPATCMNLTIESGASVTIQPGKALTVSGILTNQSTNSGLVIQSGTAGTGSLLHYANTVPATVNNYITGNEDPELKKYHFVSIPTSYASPTSNLFLNSYLYKLDADQQEPTNNNNYGKWVSLGTSTSTALSNNLGYMIYLTGDSKTYTFEGNLNNGNFTPALTGHSGNYTFNLIPNPYPSPINWGNADGWSKSAGVGGTCYIWNAASGNYTSLSSSTDNYIPVGQGFMVMVYNESSPSLIIRNAARAHSSQGFYKSAVQQSKSFVINVKSTHYSDRTEVLFREDATAGFDLQIDGMKIQGLEEAPQLFTVTDGQRYSINNLPVSDKEKIVPMHFSCSQGGAMELTAVGAESFPSEMNLYLKDLLTGQVINLRQQAGYTFTHVPGNNPDRFELIFGQATGIAQEEFSGRFWIEDNRLTISAPGLEGKAVHVEVFDLIGRRIIDRMVLIQGLTRLQIPSEGYVIARISSGDSVTTFKGFSSSPR